MRGDPINALTPTHRCRTCGALWRACDDGRWNLRGGVPGVCCNNAPMTEPNIQRLDDRIAGLEAALAEAQASDAESLAIYRNCRDRCDAMQAELAEAQKDAARYRWLRGDICPDHSVRWAQWDVRRWKAPRWTDDLRGDALDAAIDAAMQKDER